MFFKKSNPVEVEHFSTAYELAKFINNNNIEIVQILTTGQSNLLYYRKK